MNKKVPDITESIEELKSLLCTAKHRHETQRLSMLYLLRSGAAKHRKHVAELIGVHRISVGQWLATYETGGLEKLLERQYAPGRVSALSGAQQAVLRVELEKPEGFQS